MENCCDATLRYALFIFNFFVFLTGIALISVGCYIQFQMTDYLNFVDEDYLNTGVVFIVLGGVILAIGFFGCCGACTENSCMIFVFAMLLTLTVLIQFGLAVAVFVFRGQTQEIVTSKMVEGMKHYSTDPNSEYAGVTETWNAMQSDFKCCGVRAPGDWKTSPFGQKDNAIPDSCCVTYSAGCGSNYFDGSSEKIHEEGCFVKMENFFMENIDLAGGIAIFVIVVQVVLVLLSCMLSRNMKKRSNYV